MGKYSSLTKQKTVVKESGPHAVWRGIGCSMFIIIPIISTAIAYEMVNYGLDNKWRFPYQLLGYPAMPDFFRYVDILWQLSAPIRGIENFYAYATFTVIVALVMAAIISTLYTYVYTIMGPPRYGPTDAPPPKHSASKKSR